jgi:hypothetical protein
MAQIQPVGDFQRGNRGRVLRLPNIGPDNPHLLARDLRGARGDDRA